MLCWSVRLVSIIGVKNLEGILGADTFNSPGLTAAALSLGDYYLVGALIIGPELFFPLSKTDVEASYLPGPTTLTTSSSLFLLPTKFKYYCVR